VDVPGVSCGFFAAEVLDEFEEAHCLFACSFECSCVWDEFVEGWYD
jgi:hypothetical protein